MKTPFKNNKKVRRAKQLLCQAVQEAQRNIHALREGDRRYKRSYQRMVDRMGRLRGRPLYFPYIGSGVGQGAFVALADGSVKYDFITGIGVHYLGHSHPKILDAAIDAALEDIVMQGNLQLNAVSLEAADGLMKMACAKGERLRHCFLTSSGAMANENAFKVIFQKKYPASRLLAFKKCFAGRSLATGRMTDKPQDRQGLPKTVTIDYIPFYDPQKPKESTAKALQHLTHLLKRHRGQYAGMCLEMVQGEGGANAGSKKFFMALLRVLKKHRVAVMVDEIQTFGRTSKPFAFQHFGLDQYVDVVTVGKMTQFCATLFTPEFNPKPGLLSQTFTASTSALHAGKAILTEISQGGYFGRTGKIARFSQRFQHHLEKLAAEFPALIKGPFGLGAMIGMTYADGSPQKTSQFVHKLYDNGVLSFSAGERPSRVRFLIPVGAVTMHDIDMVCGIIKKTVEELN